MAARRRRSLLEDDDLVDLERDTPSGGDVCERCHHSRDKHLDDGPCLKCGKCEQFEG